MDERIETDTRLMFEEAHLRITRPPRRSRRARSRRAWRFAKSAMHAAFQAGDDLAYSRTATGLSRVGEQRYATGYRVRALW